MTLLMPLIASRMFNTPLLIDAGKAVAILTGMGGRIVEGGVEFGDTVPVDHIAFAKGRPSESLGTLGDRLGRSYEQAGAGNRIFDRIGPVAIIPIEGTLVHKGAFLGQSSGEMSMQGIQTKIQARRVRAIRFDDPLTGLRADGGTRRHHRGRQYRRHHGPACDPADDPARPDPVCGRHRRR
jgi:hypothetical protein